MLPQCLRPAAHVQQDDPLKIQQKRNALPLFLVLLVSNELMVRQSVHCAIPRPQVRDAAAALGLDWRGKEEDGECWKVDWATDKEHLPRLKEHLPRLKPMQAAVGVHALLAIVLLSTDMFANFFVKVFNVVF